MRLCLHAFLVVGLLAGCRAEPAGSPSPGPVEAGPKTPKDQAHVGVSNEQDPSLSEDSVATATTTATTTATSSTTEGGSTPTTGTTTGTTTLTAGPTDGSASDSVEPTAAGAGEKACGWVPTGTRNFDTYYRGRAGCGLAPEGPDAWQTITEVETVGLELRKKGSTAYVVFLDAKGQRVLPIGKTVSYEMRFRRKKRGKIRITAAQNREGVFAFKLPGNSHSKPCTMHLFMRFNNGTEVIEDWLDDWVYKC